MQPKIQSSLFPQILQVGSAYHKFGFKLFVDVVKQEAGKNVFLSPHSVATVLSMLYVGASGDTRRALEKTLHLEGLDPEVIKQVNREFLRVFSQLDPGVELTLANSVWVRMGLDFKSDYLEQVGEFYEAEIRGLDFGDPGAATSINEWAATKTKGKISHIVDRLDSQMVMALMNAIYFKGQWFREFDLAKTQEKPFHLDNGKQKPVPMMSRSGSYKYCEGRGFQAVVLPYRDERFGLYLFLPGKERSLDAFLQELNEANWEQWMLEFSEHPGEVVLPRFKFEYGTVLNGTLTAMGMGEAFHLERANFQGIRAARDVFINQVVQKALVEVNEEGTEAAATTVAKFRFGAPLEPPKLFRLVADRPFFFAIRDNQSRVVLFMGVVNDPS
jgi:serpin B